MPDQSDPALLAYSVLLQAPVPELSVPAAAAVLALPVDRATLLLRELQDSQLVTESAPGRYRTGAGRMPGDDTPWRRLVDFYLHTAYAADRMVWPNHPVLELAPPEAGCVPEPLADRDAALAWLDAEHDCLIAIHRFAVDAGLFAAVWQLALSLKAHLVLRGESDEQLALLRDALTAAQALGDVPAQVLVHRFYGQAFARAGLPEQATAQLRLAVDIADEHGDPALQAQAYYLFAWVRSEAGANREALEHAVRARVLFRATGETAAEAEALNAIGWYHTLLVNLAQATACCSEALELARRHGFREGEAAALDSLGLIAQRAGRHRQAIEHYCDALAVCVDLGNSYQEAGILDRLGSSYVAVGQPSDARLALRRALELYRDQRRFEEMATVERRLDPSRSPENQALPIR